MDDKGDPVSWDDYYPFGLQMLGRSQTQQTNPLTDVKFTGHELNQEGDLGIYYAEARLYDPAIGRFMQQDPLAGMYPGVSPYVYVMNNPLKFIDPDGRAIWREGEGYIDGHRAKELTKKVIGKALRGERASIDFVQRSNSWEDAKDFFRGKSYRHGGMRDQSCVIVGDQTTVNMKGGSTKLTEYYIQTAYSHEDIEYSKTEYMGTTSTGEDFVTLAFTGSSSGEIVVKYRGEVGDINNQLEEYGLQLVRYTQGYRTRNTGTGEITEHVTIYYKMEQIKEEE